jgi:DUF1016 N-terminal domain
MNPMGRNPQSKILLSDLRELIESARQDVAQRVNSTLVILYWRVGTRIRQDVLKEKRAEYGEQIVTTLSAQLVQDFGSSFSTRNLWHMLRFAEVFPDEKIVNALSTELGWTHLRVATYWIEVLPKRQLRKKLHEAILHARERMAQRKPSLLEGKDPSKP